MDSQQAFEVAASALDNEATLMKGLYHPNIARLRGLSIGGTEAYYQTGRHDSYFLIMEQVEETLTQRIARWQNRQTLYKWRTIHGLLRQKQFEKNFLLERLRVAFDIADAIEYIHTHGICHHSLHGRSIAFNTQNQVQISEFGCARKCTTERTTRNVTENNTVDGGNFHESYSSVTTAAAAAAATLKREESDESHTSTRSVSSSPSKIVGLQQDVLDFTWILCEILTMRSSSEASSINDREGKAYVRAFRSLASVIPRRLLGMIHRGLNGNGKNDSNGRLPSIADFRECLSEVMYSMTKDGNDTAFGGGINTSLNKNWRKTRRPTELGLITEAEEMRFVYRGEVEEGVADNTSKVSDE
jgi:hypothetical protein